MPPVACRLATLLLEFAQVLVVPLDLEGGDLLAKSEGLLTVCW
ncbi:hypothetical protein ACWGQT_04260 [Streptomyces yangpuensis]